MSEKNQCDGCQAGQPLRGNLHTDDGGHAVMSCQRERYAAPPAAQAEPPTGFVLVPVEPTPEMIAAWPNGRHGAGHEAAIYRAMLAAAPAPAAHAGDALPPTVHAELKRIEGVAAWLLHRFGPGDVEGEHAALLGSVVVNLRAALAARGQAGEREAWIPVSERLPADGENVVAWLDGAPEIVGYRKG